MRVAFGLACGLLIGSVLHAQQYPHIAPTDPKTPAEELKTFKVPEGFEVQLVAADPDIRKPIQIAFDAKGRLWATTSEEYPYPALGRPGKDRLYVMEDFGADGKAKKISIFADDLNIPIGVLPLPDCKSVIVSSVDTTTPKKGEFPICWIWKLTDTDGDGKADKKEKLYGPFGARDTHGMNNSYTLMPDGWVYACHGYMNDSRPKGKDGHEIFMNSGNTFRFRPDGSRIEIWTRGQVNPFGIAVDPYFNLYTADCHSKPITQLIRGATYQSFAKGHDGLGFAPHVTVHGHESTALCGLAWYAADHYPKEYLDHLFLGNVTSNCINWDKIEFKGSTPVATDKGQFLSSSDLWCRPTDIKLGPDGALYWADFYNKIIGHYEVGLDHPDRDKLRGRVWRIVWKGKDGKGASPKTAADLSKLTANELIAALGATNLCVRLSASLELQRRGVTNVPGEVIQGNDLQGAHALWLLKDTPTTALIEMLSKTPLDSAALKAVHLLRVLQTRSKWSDLEWIDIASAINQRSVNRHLVERVWMEAIVAHPNQTEILKVIGRLEFIRPEDTHGQFAARVALREQLLAGKSYTDLPLTSANHVLLVADVLMGIPNEAASQFLINHFRDFADSGRLPQYIQHATRFAADDAAIAQVLTFARSHKADDLRTSLQLFQAFQRGCQQRGKSFLGDKDALTQADRLCYKAIESSDPMIVQGGIDIAVTYHFTPALAKMAELAVNKEKPEALRLTAIGALSAFDAGRAVPTLRKVLNDSTASFTLREKSAQVLAAINRADAHDELTNALTAAPARLQTVIAMAMAGNVNAAEKLLKAITEGKASARLLQDNAVQTRLREARVPNANQRVAALTKGLPTADQKMLGLMKQRSAAFAKTKPDAMLGKAIFTKNCAICHQIGNEGTKIGPQLDGIGGRGLDRLLEDTLDPNRNVDAAFRMTTLMLKDGKSVPGLLLREEGQIVVMADDKGKEVRVPKDDIDEKRTSLLSPMPANLSEALPEKDFHDLMAYLLTQRPKDK